MKLLTAAVLPLALACTACDIRVDEGGLRGVGMATGRAEDVWARTYTLPATGTFAVVGGNGEIEVTAAEGLAVEVRAEREARADTDEAARALLQALHIREEVTADSVRLSVAGEESTWAPPGFGRRAQTRVRYRIRVPPGLTLTFRTDNGGIRLTGVDGRLTASTINGGITGEDLAGSADIETTNGGIRLDLASVGGDVRVAATNGGVRLTLPRDVGVTLDASSINGGVTLDRAFGAGPTERRGGRVRAPINGGGPAVTIRVVNGGIRIRPRDAARTD